MTEPLSPFDAIERGAQPFPSESGQLSVPGPVVTPGVYHKGRPGFIEPGSDLHSATISPSKVAAVLSVSRWESAYRLWHRIKGITPPEPDKDEFRVGHAFEPTLAYFWRDENPGWQLSRGEVQFVGDASRFGFPYVCTLDRRARSGQSRRIVEFKTCRGMEEWGDEFTDQAPPDYVCQVIAQMLLTGFTKNPAHLVVLNKIGCGHHTYVIEYNEAIAEAIIESCRAFWQSLALDEAPPLDDSVATYECVREQHPDIEKGEEAEIPVELATEYHAALANLDEAEKRARFAKTQVLDQMKRANFAIAGDARVARRQPGTRGAVALYSIKPGSKAAAATNSARQQHDEEIPA